VYYDEAHGFTGQDVDLACALANHLASVVARFDAVRGLEKTLHDNQLFAGVLAHDLRNPLEAILTCAELLRGRDGANKALERPLARIVHSAQRMARMIEQLLDFTRARAGGGIEVRRRDADLAELCGQAIGELEVANPGWRISHEVVGDPRGRWDPDLVLQVISNLVANAGQHGRPGAAIGLRLDGTAPDHVVLEVRNQGAIPPDLVPTLFDPFRASRQRRRAHGLGLGLFIVKQIVQAHRGSVAVTSDDVDGTCVTVRLPRTAAPRRRRQNSIPTWTVPLTASSRDS
jgi:signal transduction histidine kinase